MQVTVHQAAIRFGTALVFEGLSARFPASQVTALVGPSGSGKSTLLAAIAGFHPLSAGRIVVGAGDEVQPPSPELVTWVAQDSNTLGFRSVLDNAALGALSDGASLNEARSEAQRCLAAVGLGDRTHAPARTLSGGERQRVAVARALASRRPLILADEPSAALDEASTRELSRLFRDACAGATLIVATHDPVMIASASDVVEIRGRAR